MTDPLEGLEVRHPAEEIRQRVAALARELETALAGERVLLVGVLRGAAMLLADLAREIALPTRLEFIDVMREADEDGSSEPRVGIRFFRHFPVRDENVVILKDVVSTGVVESYLISQLRAGDPRSVRLACVIDRPPVRRVALDVDAALFVEPEPEVWVGYGLDPDSGHLAALPDLAIRVD